jgi:hypothetical protein
LTGIYREKVIEYLMDCLITILIITRTIILDERFKYERRASKAEIDKVVITDLYKKDINHG